MSAPKESLQNQTNLLNTKSKRKPLFTVQLKQYPMCFIKEKPIQTDILFKEDNFVLQKEDQISITPATSFANFLSSKRKFINFNDGDDDNQPKRKIQKISILDSPASPMVILDNEIKKKENIFDIARLGDTKLLLSLKNNPLLSIFVNDTEPRLHDTALHFAITHNHISFVQELVKFENIDLNISNIRGNTPLLHAIDSGNSAIVRILISKGANISIPDNQGFTSLHKAILNGNLEIIRILLNHENYSDILNSTSTEQKLTPLHQASFHGKISAMKLLLKTTGINISPKTSNNSTPLHMAALKNHSKAIELLLKNGVQPDEKDNHLRTALHYSCIYGHLDTAKLLVNYNCSVQEKDIKDQTPLEIAAKANLLDLTLILSQATNC